jgi:ribosomal protein S18 acetylase RimI-like enzyme
MITRRPLADRHDPALAAFIAQHLLPGLPADPAFLINLSGGENCIADIWKDGQRVAVALLIDTCANYSDSGEILFLAARTNPVPEDIFLCALTALEAQAAKGPRRNIEINLKEPVLIHRALLAQRGYALDYTLHEMQIETVPAQSPADLAANMRWVGVDDTNKRAHFDLICESFADIPGTHIPEWDMFRDRPPNDLHALLLVDEMPAAFIQLMTTPDGYGEINIIGRGQKFRGIGLGDILLQESLLRLSQAGMKRAGLFVATTNTGALDLYKRHGFMLKNSVDVLNKAVKP